MPRYKQPESTFSIQAIVRHPALLFFLAASVTLGGAMTLWNKYRDNIVATETFQLVPEKIELVNGEPDWIKQPVADMIANQLPINSTLDPQLVPHVANFLESLGWVRQIDQIRKSQEGLSLDLRFRSPVATVVATLDQSLPVDGEGVLMDPSIIKADMLQRVPRIAVYRPINTELHTWNRWPDKRIQDGAALSAYLGQAFFDFGFRQIVSFQGHRQNAKPEPLELWPRAGAEGSTTVIWGSAPGQEIAGEASAEQKFIALQEYVAQNGTLEKSTAGKNVDVRSGKAIVSRRIRTAKSANMFAEMK